MDWFLYDIGLRHERVNKFKTNIGNSVQIVDSTEKMVYNFTI